MLHHVSVGVRDIERSARFYDAVLGALGYVRVMEVLPHGIAYGEEEPSFWIQMPHNQQLATAGNGVHISFVGRSAEDIDDFYKAALEMGGEGAGEPGPRPDYSPNYYGAFVYDLDGNKLEATLVEEPELIEVAFADEGTPTKVKHVKKTAKKTAAKKSVKKAAKKVAKKAAPAKKAVKKAPAKKAAKKVSAKKAVKAVKPAKSAKKGKKAK